MLKCCGLGVQLRLALLGPLIPEPKRRKDGRGRPWKDRREVLNGILYILRTGAPWADLPESYPPTRPAIVDSSTGCVRA
jgi:transposase